MMHLLSAPVKGIILFPLILFNPCSSPKRHCHKGTRFGGVLVLDLWMTGGGLNGYQSSIAQIHQHDQGAS